MLLAPLAVSLAGQRARRGAARPMRRPRPRARWCSSARRRSMGAAISYKVRENGVELCKLRNGTFCTVQAPVGKHEYVTQTEAKDVLTLEVEPGETYYVVGAASRWASWQVTPNLSPSEQGRLRRHEGKAQGQHRARISIRRTSQGQEVAPMKNARRARARRAFSRHRLMDVSRLRRLAGECALISASTMSE